MIENGTEVEYIVAGKHKSGIWGNIRGYSEKHNRYFVVTRNGHLWMLKKKNLKVSN